MIKKIFVIALLAIFTLGAVSPVLATNKVKNKSWSKIKDIFK